MTLSNPPEISRDRTPGHRLARGVLSALGDLGFEALGEFPAPKGRRMDLCAIGPKGEIWCVEVKSSRADFQADDKWQLYLPWCERLFFAVPQSFPSSILPADQGLILADDWDAEILRLPAERPMAPGRRRSMTLSFARLAAHRLTTGGDWRSADGPTSATPFLP